MLAQNDLSEAAVMPQILRAKARVERYVQRFRQGQPLDIGGRLVILTDDGIATGETMKAAIRWVKSKQGAQAAQGIVVAVPVSTRPMEKEVTALVDALVCPLVPRRFFAVGQFYYRFEQVSDAQVLEALQPERLTSAGNSGNPQN
jgi:predicted phosphoribosyltransferase